MQRSGERSRQAARVARGELIGRTARVSASNDPTLVGLEGRVVDETMNTLVLQADGRRTVPKAGQGFAFTINQEEVLLSGQDLAFRPEDRIKKVRVKR